MAALRNLGLLDSEDRMTHAGAWLLARDVRRFTTSAHVSCALFLGTDWGTVTFPRPAAQDGRDTGDAAGESRLLLRERPKRPKMAPERPKMRLDEEGLSPMTRGFRTGKSPCAEPAQNSPLRAASFSRRAGTPPGPATSRGPSKSTLR